MLFSLVATVPDFPFFAYCRFLKFSKSYIYLTVLIFNTLKSVYKVDKLAHSKISNVKAISVNDEYASIELSNVNFGIVVICT